MTIIAKAGDRVTCELGHHICDVAEDIKACAPGPMLKQFTNWRGYVPLSGRPVHDCNICGRKFIRWTAGLLGGCQLHVKGEWRG